MQEGLSLLLYMRAGTDQQYYECRTMKKLTHLGDHVIILCHLYVSLE